MGATFSIGFAGWLTDLSVSDLCSAVVDLGYGGSVFPAAAVDVEVPEDNQGRGH
jgi:hypothetical protein